MNSQNTAPGLTTAIVSAGEQAIKEAKNPEIKAFGQIMIKDHGEAEQQLLKLAKSEGINLVLQTYATTGKDPAVKAWAQQMLPILKMHLEHIKTIEKQVH